MGRGERSFRSWVRRVAENYVQAGSRVILTNTFRATCISLAPYGLQGQVDINRAGVKISRQAAGLRRGRSQLRARHSRFHPGLRTAGGRYAAAGLD